MRIHESLSKEEALSKFKPITIKPQDWTFGPSINEIIKCKKTYTGNIIYLVKLKDGKIIKVSENSLNDKYKLLIKGFNKQTPKIQKEDVIDYPNKKRKLVQKKFKPKNKKRVAFLNESDSKSANESDSSDSLFSNVGVEHMSPNITTKKGRKTVKPISFEEEFYNSMPVDKSIKKSVRSVSTKTFNIPFHVDDVFSDHHSVYCFRCKAQWSNYRNGKSTQVTIGYEEERSRFLMCNSCSFSFHNNCMSPVNIQVDKENGNLTCQKCLKSRKCSRCNKSKSSTTDVETVSLRCTNCIRSFHYDCMTSYLPLEIKKTDQQASLMDLYHTSICYDCTIHKGKILEDILSERTLDGRLEYLVKWKNRSFRRAQWVPADWIINAFNPLYRGYLKRKEQNRLVPYSKEWSIVDRILNVEWEDKSTLKVKKILAVFKDREYAEAEWDEPPTEEETDLYPDYQRALKKYIEFMNVSSPKNMKTLISQVRSQATAESYEKHELKSQPKFINGGTLMKHQMEALNWLIYQWEQQQSCILADDMGLGKTIQIITFLYYLFKKFSIYPFLIVVPNSTATNWVREFEKWAPELLVVPYFGPGVARKLALENEILDNQGRVKCHAVVVTYESALERSKLYDITWSNMVVDESQRLKNDESLLFKNLKRLRVDHTVLLSGTPLQTNIRELFNIMNFIQPKSFNGNEAEEYEDLTTAQVEELHNRLRPHFLRRTKEEVLKTLPPKYELIVPVTMTTLQKEVYKQCLNGEIHETLAQTTMAKRQKGLSNIFINLKKVLNHPYLLDGVEAPQNSPAETQKNMIQAAAKLILFHQMLPKLIERGHRILVFSTMTRVLDLLEDYLEYENVKYVRIDGSTRERDRVRHIDTFNAPDSDVHVFLLSTRAGGVGINLATADTVIIWDSDSNPYADLQAISRAHRIGQRNMVLIYRLMTRLSVEEKVLQIAKKRMALEHVIVERMNENEEENLEDIESILKYGTEALFSDDHSKDITYDAAAIENLLNREQYREIATEQQLKEVSELEGKASEGSAMNFSFARVWKMDGTPEALPENEDPEIEQKDTDFWDKFLLEQQALIEKKKEEKKLEELNLGRGARKRATIKYTESSDKKPSGKDDDIKNHKDSEDDEFVAEQVVTDDDDASVDGKASFDAQSELLNLISLDPQKTKTMLVDNQNLTSEAIQDAQANTNAALQQSREAINQYFQQKSETKKSRKLKKAQTLKQQGQQPVPLTTSWSASQMQSYDAKQQSHILEPFSTQYSSQALAQALGRPPPQPMAQPVPQPPSKHMPQHMPQHVPQPLPQSMPQTLPNQPIAQQQQQWQQAQQQWQFIQQAFQPNAGNPSPLTGPGPNPAMPQNYTADIRQYLANIRPPHPMYYAESQTTQALIDYHQKQLEKQQREQEEQKKKEKMEKAVEFYTKAHYTALRNQIDNLMFSLKNDVETAIKNDSLDLTTFNQTAVFIVDTIKKKVLDISRGNAEIEKEMDRKNGMAEVILEELHQKKENIIQANISQAEPYIREKVDTLVATFRRKMEDIEAEKQRQKQKRFEYLRQKHAMELQKLIQKQNSEMRREAEALMSNKQIKYVTNQPAPRSIQSSNTSVTISPNNLLHKAPNQQIPGNQVALVNRTSDSPSVPVPITNVAYPSKEFTNDIQTSLDNTVRSEFSYQPPRAQLTAQESYQSMSLQPLSVDNPKSTITGEEFKAISPPDNNQ